MKYFFSFLLCFIASITEAQTYKLECRIEDSSVKKVELLFIKRDTAFSVDQKIAEVKDGTVTFTGTLPYPYAAYVRYNDNVRSEMFIIDAGVQQITVKDPESRMEILNSPSTKEYYEDYLPRFSVLERTEDSVLALYGEAVDKKFAGHRVTELRQILQRFKSERKKIFLQYVNEHRNSYVSLWTLFFKVTNGGYSETYEEAFNTLTTALQNNVIGRRVKEELESAFALSVGKTYPVLRLPEYLTGKTVEILPENKKLILVDFWFAACGPCVRQFPKLSEIYRNYKSKGFEIVGVSTDVSQDVWKKAVSDRGLKWKNYLDRGGEVASKMVINAFPANFLLDAEGKIIRKNIEPDDLEKLLRERLR